MQNALVFNRTRESGALSFKGSNYFHPYAYPSGIQTWGCYIGERKLMRDVVTKNWRDIARTGRLVVNPLYQERVSVEAKPSSFYAAYQTAAPLVVAYHDWLKGEAMGVPSSYAGEANSLQLITPSDHEALAVEARTACLADIGVSANQWENLAEMHKTRDMVLNPLSTWFKWQRRNRLTSVGTSLARLWLTYRYGVLPLVKGTMEVVENLQNKGDDVDWFKTRAKREWSASSTSTYLWEPDGQHHATTTISRKEKVTIRCISYDRGSWNIMDQLGLSAKALMLTPWELIPHSFVADWLVNAGDYLASVIQKSFYPESLAQCEVGVNEIEQSWQATAMWGTGGLVISSPNIGTITGKSIYRGRTVGLGQIGLRWKVSAVNPWKKFFGLTDLNGANADRVRDSFALAALQIVRMFGR